MCNTETDARPSGSVFVARIHKWTCCPKSRKDAQRPSETGAFPVPGSSIFPTVTPVPTPTPPRLPTTFLGRDQLPARNVEIPAVLPKTPPNAKSRTAAPPPTENRKGAPPRETQKRQKDIAQLFTEKRSWSWSKRGCRKPTYERTLHMIAQESHSNGGRAPSCAIIPKQRGLSETHIRTNITHDRGRVAFQWRAHALSRDCSEPKARVSLFPPAFLPCRYLRGYAAKTVCPPFLACRRPKGYGPSGSFPGDSHSHFLFLLGSSPYPSHRFNKGEAKRW